MNVIEENKGDLKHQPEESQENLNLKVEETKDLTKAEDHAISESAEITPQEVAAEEAPEVTQEKVEANEVAEPNAVQDDQDIEEIEDDEAAHFSSDDIDVESFDKKDFVILAERMLEASKKSNASVNDIRNIDSVYKEIRGAYDEIHSAEIEEAKAAYIKANESDEGFAFKNDNYDIRFESLMIQIRDRRNDFFKNLEALRENYFERKTALLQRLRDVVEREETGSSKENWEAFKQIQNEWRDAGNINSPHNGSLWSAYNALLDRYFDIRSIQNELKELDRKKNLEVREGFVEKIEEIAAGLKDQELTNGILKKANELLNEYKHTGPGPRAEQEKLWERMKAAFDIIYDKKRNQSSEGEKLMEEVFQAKSALLEKIKPFASFQSDRINDWNAKSKEILEIQEQWNKLKGPMPRDKAKETSKEFWAGLKSFFKAKSAFFNELEAERKVNLEGKENLCKQVEALLAEGDTSADNTNKVIELQKEWKTFGHVPQKYKDSIYKRFKEACDGFFELKREGGKEQRKEFEENLAAKVALCEKIEAAAKAKETDLAKLNEWKRAFNEIGFVPRNDIKKIQKRFVDAINSFVLSSSDIDKEEKDKLVLRNEVDVTMKSSAGNPKAMQRQESDLRRKLRTLEDEITQLKTNIEFFGRSKGAEKFKVEYEKKIAKAEEEVEKIKGKITVINEAE